MKLQFITLTLCFALFVLDGSAQADSMSYGLPDNPDLLYEPTSGNVKIFADDANVISFNLQSSAQFNPPVDFSDLTADTLGIPSTNIDNTASAIGWVSAVSGGGIGFDGPSGSVNTPYADLGNVFPTGLDLTGLQTLLTNNQWAYQGGGGEFDLVVPEPSSILLLAMGVIGLFIGSGRLRMSGRASILAFPTSRRRSEHS